jgi:hypothetical protein
MIKDLISKEPWQAVKNSSWGTAHQENFGNRSGYVICYNDKHRQLSALANVIGQPFVPQSEIDANAALIEAAPQMFDIIEKIAQGIDIYEIEDLVTEAEEIVTKLNSIKQSKEVPLC